MNSTAALAKGKLGRMAYSRARVPEFTHVEFSAVPNALQNMPAVALLLLAATILEASGDAVVRVAIYNHAGIVRLGLFVAGAALLFSYGTLLNLAPVQFGQVVGLYLASLFVVWQIVNFVAFRALPTLPILLGGSLIIAGGALITFWNPALGD
jgi:small multidrug resistance family-3 protein